MEFSERCSDVEVVINTLINDMAASGTTWNDDQRDVLVDAYKLVVEARLVLKYRELHHPQNSSAKSTPYSYNWPDPQRGTSPCTVNPDVS